MAREPVATLLVAGLPTEIAAALRARLDGCTVLEAATDVELRERVREAPDVLALSGWSLGDDPAATVRAWRSAGALSATKVLCCLATPADPALPSQLVDELSVSRLLFLPLDVEETLRHLGELAGVPVLPATPVSRESRASAGIAAVWARFREPTLARIDVIDSAAMALLDGALTNELRLDAQREAHKLAGAAGSFGFPRSSQIARQIEEQLSLGGLTPADAVPMAEQLLALRADLEGTPRVAEPEPTGEQRREEVTLLLVGAEHALNERMTSEGAARGVRVVTTADPRAAHAIAEQEAPTVVAVCITTMDQAAPSLDLMEALANADRSAAGLVLAPRDADAIRVEAARRGARRFVELPSSPSTIVTQALELAGRASAEPRRVLAVDDDPRILELLRTVLGWSGRDVHTTSDPLQFWSVLERVRPDLLVLDVDMPHVTGIELARAVRTDPRWSHLPIIFLTARTDADTVRRAYAAGADDHIGKPLVAEELITRVRNRLERASAAPSADVDPMTGVDTLRRTTDLLARFLHLAQRRGDALTVASVALDDLPGLESRHGAVATELGWRALAQLFTRSLRGEDIVGRWSPGELVVGMYGASKSDVSQRLTALLAIAGRRELPLPSGVTFTISASVGIAQFPEDGPDVERLHAAARSARLGTAGEGAPRVRVAGAAARVRDERAVDVVLVDDDEALVGLLEHALETSGRSVHVYRDGESAAADLLADPPLVMPRAILLDVDLPALNGLDLLRRLHRGGVTARSHVVMLTARAGEQDVLTALSLGASDHVTKPFSVAVLLQKLRAAFPDDE